MTASSTPLLAFEGVRVGDGPAAPVPSLDLAIAAGTVAAVAVETDDRPALASLLAGGRLRPTAGAVTLDGQPVAARELHAAVALVDTPGIGEPSPGIRLATAVGEELAAAGRPSGRRAVREALARHGLADAARVPVRSIPTADRIRLLAGLAAERGPAPESPRDGIRLLVLTSPERHGGDPRAWAPSLQAIAAGGVAVLVVTDAPTLRVLLEAGVADATAPLPEPALVPLASTDSPRIHA